MVSYKDEKMQLASCLPLSYLEELWVGVIDVDDLLSVRFMHLHSQREGGSHAGDKQPRCCPLCPGIKVQGCFEYEQAHEWAPRVGSTLHFEVAAETPLHPTTL